jgi:hypothetical protein
MSAGRFIRRVRVSGDAVALAGAAAQPGEVVARLPPGNYRCNQDDVGFHVKRGDRLIATFREGKYRAAERDDGTVDIEYLGDAFAVHEPHAPERVHDRRMLVQNSAGDTPQAQQAQLRRMNERNRQFWRDRQR